MRKHSKFITILLSALLAVCLVQTVFVQAFATEMGDDDFGWGNASTSDEAETVYPFQWKLLKHLKLLLFIKVYLMILLTRTFGKMLYFISFTATVKNLM